MTEPALTDNSRIVVEIVETPPDFPEHTATALERVLRDVATERAAQIAAGYDPGHDDAHDAEELEEHIAARLLSAARATSVAGYRRRLVQTAALALAAVERWDRRHPGGAP